MAELPIGSFIKTRLLEYDPSFELRPGTAFDSLFFKPMELITQPFMDECYRTFISQSFSRILSTNDPDAWDEASVDALAANLFVFRRLGATSAGTVRVYYNDPADYEYPATGFVAVASNGQQYTNTAPFSITRSVMLENIEEGMYYYDINVESEEGGSSTTQEIGGIVSVLNDNNYIRATNLAPIEGGIDRETNTELIERVQKSIGVRDLLTGKGINAILFENFPNTLMEMTAIGFGDQEMMRDILYNTHVGGKVDAYVKTNLIAQGFSDFIGLQVDTTRRTPASKNTQLSGTSWADLGNPNIDRTDGPPVVMQIKNSVPGEYTSTVDMTYPIDLSVNQYIKIGIDGVIKDVRVAGVTPATTTRNEIISLINYAFGVNVVFTSGNTIRIKSPTIGLTSQVLLDNPTIGTSALDLVFGLSTGGAPYIFQGDGPITFLEGLHYEVDDVEGRVRRVIGAPVILTLSSGQSIDGSDHFEDLTPGIFNAVNPGDILTIEAGPDIGDYRILEVLNDNELIIDAELTDTSLAVIYSIARTGIKNEELCYITYQYNPVSIDVGKLVKLDSFGRTRGIRPGREEYTITDLPILRINSIEEIDPLTLEPVDVILNGMSGFGRGGFGRGGFGRGDGADYFFLVNSPAERFSMFEDSYIVFQSALVGLSVRVHYDYVPAISGIHDFCRSDYERIVDGDVLVKHYLPAYVSGTITYSISASLESTAPTNEAMTDLLKNYINNIPSNTPLDYSDIVQFMARTLDPYDRYETFIRPFTLTAEVHNTNGTTLKTSGTDRLEMPTLDPFPIETDRPLSPRITHWVADNITLVRS